MEKDQKEKVAVIILAAGKGLRMGTKTRKQYLTIEGVPMIARTVAAFDSKWIDRIIVTAPQEEVAYMKEEVLGHYPYQTPVTVIAGGEERYDSVYQGIKEASGCDLVLVHDGARPFVTEQIIRDNLEGARRYGSVVTAVPVTDTIKQSFDGETVADTPDRSTLYIAQTPQSFRYQILREAFEQMYQADPEERRHITDDVMVVQQYLGVSAHMEQGSYGNKKITTQEDLNGDFQDPEKEG